MGGNARASRTIEENVNIRSEIHLKYFHVCPKQTQTHNIFIHIYVCVRNFCSSVCCIIRKENAFAFILLIHISSPINNAPCNICRVYDKRSAYFCIEVVVFKT